jgi:small-conductance mechanosensitive channel
MADPLTPSQAFEPLRGVGEQIVAFLPKAAGVLGVLIAGILASYLLRRVTRWLVRRTGIEAFAERIGASRALYALGAKKSVAHVLGSVVWIAGLLVTFSVVAEMLALPGLAEGVAAVTAFLPRLMAAGFIVVAGMFLADIANTLIVRIGEHDNQRHLESPRLVGRFIYYTILTVAVALAVGQVGLDTTLLNILIGVVAAAIFFSAGLAFAQGARDVVRNIMAGHYLRSVCAPGDTMTVGDVSGVVVAFAATSVVLRSEAGEHIIPCAMALDRPILVKRIAAAAIHERAESKKTHTPM